MSIRIRKINGIAIALCAARSMPKEGDIYLDDAAHHALGKKFSRDYYEMYGYDLPYHDADLEIIEQEESNNPNRTWWDSVYRNKEPNSV